MQLFSLAKRTALVTGASSGLGAHFATVLSAQGARVVLAARREDRLMTLAKQINASGGEALPVAMDVTDPESVDAAFAKIQSEWGAPADILINNSGLSRESWFAQMSEEDWATVIDTNLTGVWRVAKVAARAMIDAGMPGSIVNTSSITALRTAPMLASYAASKAGVDHLTRIMAIEMARFNIRVNAIAPGYFQTEINADFLESEHGGEMLKRVPMRRFGKYEELDGPLLLLASDAGSFMTGETIVVDGGHSHTSL